LRGRGRTSGSRSAAGGTPSLQGTHVVCCYCHQVRHIQRHCPSLLSSEQTTSVAWSTLPDQDQQATPVYSANVSMSVGGCSTCQAPDSTQKPREHDFDSVNVAVSHWEADTRLHMCQGLLNGRDVQVMLDSGCTTVGARRSMLEFSQCTDQVQHCRQFSGEVIQMPLANVHLKTPYFEGSVMACVIDDPICDVILGSIPGANIHCV